MYLMIIIMLVCSDSDFSSLDRYHNNGPDDHSTAADDGASSAPCVLLQRVQHHGRTAPVL